MKTFGGHIVFIALVMVAPSHGQRIEAFFSADSVTVGDRFQLTMIIGHDGTRSALFPHSLLPDSLKLANAPFTLGDFEILSVLGQGGRPYDNGGRIDSVVYEVTTFALDSARVAGFPFGLSTETDTLFGMSAALTLQIGSLVPEDATEIKDLMPLAEFKKSWWPWILGGLALLAVAGLLWWWRRRQNQLTNDAPVVLEATPPYDEAISRLMQLEQFDLADPAAVKPFYVELTDILRTYVGRRIHVPALESTTRELLDRLKASSEGRHVPSEVIAEINDVLSHADLVKFADLRPILEQTKAMVTETREAIDGTESAFRKREEIRRVEEAERLKAEQYAPGEAVLQEEEDRL